jgi:DNA-binding CsgD family transcriptional regulator
MYRLTHSDARRSFHFLASCDASAGFHQFATSVTSGLPACIGADVTVFATANLRAGTMHAVENPRVPLRESHVLLECLREEVVSAGWTMTPGTASRVMAWFREVQSLAPADHHLTPHEVRLLRFLADGHSYKTAAATLGSSVHTVAFHMKHIYAKLRVHSKSEAVAKALRDRIIQ